MHDKRATLAEVEDILQKNAGFLQQASAATRGFVSGAKQVAHQQGVKQELQGAINTLHHMGALPAQVKGNVVQALPHGVGVGDRGPGVLARLSEKVKGAVGGAKQEFAQTRAADQAVDRFKQIQQGEAEVAKATATARAQGLNVPDALAGQKNYRNMSPEQYLQMHGHAVPAHHQTPAPRPAPQAAPQGSAALPPGPQMPYGQALAPPPQQAAPALTAQPQQNWAPRNAGALGLAGGAALLGTTAWRGNQAATEQEMRMRDYQTNAQGNMATPMPSMAVYASYEKFAALKAQPPKSPYTPVYPTMQGALANSLASQLASKFIGDPIDAIQKVLKKKFYDEPKHRASYDHAMLDPDLIALHKDKPDVLPMAFGTLKKFAPTMSQDPGLTRTWLRQVAQSGMHDTGPDFATLRIITEAEKNLAQAKGNGNPW